MTPLGRYLLDSPLGSGAFGSVWRGFDPDLDSVVAVKVLAENWAMDADVRERFLTEARLLRRIVHPAVVRVHDVGVEVVNGVERPYLVMDFVSGGTLADRIGAVAPAQATELLVQAAGAVQVLHDAGVIHRDVKPSNLLVDDSGGSERVLVADLGSAKLVQQLSLLTMVAGTPAYMAPEQAAMRSFDERADVYALGVVAYQLYAGRLPDGPGPVPRVAAEVGLPAGVDRVLAAATAIAPEDRLGSAEAFASALAAAAAGDRVILPAARRTWPLAGVAVLALVLFVVAGVAAWRL